MVSLGYIQIAQHSRMAAMASETTARGGSVKVASTRHSRSLISWRRRWRRRNFSAFGTETHDSTIGSSTLLVTITAAMPIAALIAISRTMSILMNASVAKPITLVRIATVPGTNN